MLTITRGTMRRRVRRVFGDVSGRNPEDVYSTFPLRGRRSGSPPGLGIDSTAFPLVRRKLNAAFEDVDGRVTLGQLTGSGTTVGDVYDAMWDSIPDRHKG